MSINLILERGVSPPFFKFFFSCNQKQNKKLTFCFHPYTDIGKKLLPFESQHRVLEYRNCQKWSSFQIRFFELFSGENETYFVAEIKMISLFVVFWSENASFCIFPFLDFLETIYIFYSARVKSATIILVCELKNTREV